jgi:threonylcarbamoyladenosine tRNA methylthiotransferase MtaB
MLTYDIRTFGCKVNTYDTGLLQKRLAAAGFQKSGQDVRLHILNTCAVTAEATKEAVRQIRKIKKSNPQSTVVVTGCAAQVDTEKFAQLKEADLIVANSHKGQLENLIKAHLRGESDSRVYKSNIFKKEDLEAGGGEEDSHTRSFLKIQDGCNSFCTFCVIPFARGKSRSLPVAELLRRINDLSARGVEEVVLTGVHIGDYLDDSEGGNYGLEDLVEKVLEATPVQRFRLSSLEPVELTGRLLSLYSKNPRLCPHFHMSIQSANTKVLKDMKRQYDQAAVEDSLLAIGESVPGAFVGMDVIAGFPGESMKEFEDTYFTLEKLPWTRIHVFPYSPREGTFSMRMSGHMHRSEIMSRAARLRELSGERYVQAAISQVGKRKKVLLLNKKQGEFTQALSRDYWPVLITDSSRDLSGTSGELEVQVQGYDTHRMQSSEPGLYAQVSL